MFSLLSNLVLRQFSVFKRKHNIASDWPAKKPLTIDTIFSDSDSGSAPGDLVDSDYASLSVTPSASDHTEVPEWTCCVWDWRTTHIGGFMKKHRLANLKKRLDALGSGNTTESLLIVCNCLVKALPTYDADIGKPPSQKTTKRSKYNPHQEAFVADVSHRTRRCVALRKRRHARIHGPVNDAMLQRVQVPVDASYSEPRVEYTHDSTYYLNLDAGKLGLTKQEVFALRDTVIPEADEDKRLKIPRLAQPVAAVMLNRADGRFWTQLNCRLWNNENGVRKDENNRHPAVPPAVVLAKSDFTYIMSLLETNCFNEMHGALLDVLSVPNQADDDNAFCEICQSVSCF
jgi:hypothetical protein